MRRGLLQLAAAALSLLVLCAPTAAAAGATFSLPRTYVVGTYDGATIRLYVDGSLVAAESLRGRLVRSNAPLEIGSYAGHVVWSGTIDEVAAYDRPLTQPAISAHHELGLLGSGGAPGAYAASIRATPGLLGYWRLDDRGPLAADATGGAAGRYRPGVDQGVPGLLGGDHDTAAGFNGRAGAVVVPAVRRLRSARAFSIEAWVTTSSLGERAIAARAGSFLLETDGIGRWRFGVFVHGRLHGVASPFSGSIAYPSRATLAHAHSTVLLWLAVIAAAIAAYALSRWWPRRRADAAALQTAQGAARRLPLVDSLRAIAALLVLAGHASVYSGLAKTGSVGAYARRLDVGVAVFFLISGLLLYRPFVLARMRGRPAPDAGAYAWRRLLRIVPAYWVALTISVVLVGTVAFSPAVFTLTGIPRYYLFAQDYSFGSISGGLPQAWTLSIEVAFYAFLPLYAWLQRRSAVRGLRRVVRLEIAGLVALVVCSEVWKWIDLSATPNRVIVKPWLVSLPAFFDQFAIGMGLAVLSAWIEVRGRHPAWVKRLDRVASASWILAAAAFWLVVAVVLPSGLNAPWTPLEYLGRQWLYAVVALFLLLPAVVGDQQRGLVRRLLANRALAWCGLISYGIYLWHGTALAELDRLGFGTHASLFGAPFLGWLAAAMSITLVVAAFSYYALEEPALSLKRLVPGRRPAPASAPEPPLAEVPIGLPAAAAAAPE